MQFRVQNCSWHFHGELAVGSELDVSSIENFHLLHLDTMGVFLFMWTILGEYSNISGYMGLKLKFTSWKSILLWGLQLLLVNWEHLVLYWIASVVYLLCAISDFLIVVLPQKTISIIITVVSDRFRVTIGFTIWKYVPNNGDLLGR